MIDKIIGIGGVKHSGKDTVASMFNYILSVGITKANYRTWLTRRVALAEQHKNKIIHFADTLKDCLSLIYNIPRKHLDDIDYKDKMWFNLYYYCFHDEDYVLKNNSNFNFIGQWDVANGSLRECISAFPKKVPVIRLRTLMQYFGTDICRDNLGYNIWVDSTIKKAIDIVATYGYCIIPDVRFQNEAAGIKNAHTYYKSVILKINRNTKDNDNHSSELTNFCYDYEVDNDGGLMQLFYKIHELCQSII